MKLHSNVIASWTILSDALTAEKNAGRIAQSVTFKTLHAEKSRTHNYGYEVQLESWEKLPGDGRRYGNSGSFGAGENYTATYDEWGWLINALYMLDSDAVWGTVKFPNYSDRQDFDEKTGYTYNIVAWLNLFNANVEYATPTQRVNECDPYGFVVSRTNTIGRRGFARNDGEKLSRSMYDAAVERFRAGVTGMAKNSYVKYEPRTVAWMTAFANGEVK